MNFITSYEDFKQVQTPSSLWWIVEYNPTVVSGENERYNLLRNEILTHPQDYAERLNNKIYRVWTVTPWEQAWN